MIKFLLILSKNIFFQELKQKITTLKFDGRNFYDQPINDSIKQYDKIRKISTGLGDDSATVFFLHFAYFED